MVKYFLSFLFIFALVSAEAQQKPAPTLTPPQLKSFWGSNVSCTLPLELTLNTIDSAVWVIDVKKNRYSLSRFIVLFRSKDRFEDEETGEIKTRFNTNSVQIRNSAFLTEQWRKMLYENIKAGDELIITDLIVRDKKGNYFRAPDVKIVIN